MFKKIIQFFLGEPEGYISEQDNFIHGHKFLLSESQQQEIANQKAIATKRD